MTGNIVPSHITRRIPCSRALLFDRTPFALQAMITSAGCDRPTGGNYDFHGLQRGRSEFAVFQYTLAGAGRLTWEGHDYELTPGKAMLVTIPHNHRYWLDEGGHWAFFYLCFNGRELLRACRTVLAAAGPVLELAFDSRPIQTAARTCLDVLSEAIDSPWRASAAGYQVAMELLAGVLPAEKTDASPRRPDIAKAIEFCRGNIDQPIGVDDLAEAAGLSRYHFTRLFTASEGQSPGRFIASQRLRRAVSLLQTTDLPVKQIAARCGYADANYFCKAFAKAYGLSPGAFRRSGMY